MPKLFGLDIAKIVADSISQAGGVLDATLTQETPGTRTVGSLTAGTNPTSIDYECKGFKEDLDTLTPASVVSNATGLISLLGATISKGTIAPKAGDVINIEGEDNTVLKVGRDPAAALYQCQVS